MDGWIFGVFGSLVTASVIGIVAIVARFLRRRVRITGPASEALKGFEAEMQRMVSIVRCLFRIQKPQLEALQAILEAQKGTINGNIDRALASVNQASRDFDSFKEDSTLGGCKEPNG